MTETQSPFGTIPAVRTVEETDDYVTIEGRAIPYGGPFNGKDTYGTFFSARTDLAMEPDLPVRIWYNHGFDSDFGFSTVGRTTSYRSEEDGIWVQAQLDKRHRYYETRVKPLLEKNALGFSPGSAEHSYREDPKTGELLSYPVHEISLTPTEANPWAMIAARSAEGITILAARATDKSGKAVGPPEGGKARKDIPAEDYAGPDKSFPIVDQGSVDGAASLIGKAADPDAVKAKVIAIAKRKGLDIPDSWRSGEAARSSSMDAASAAGIVSSLLYLRDCEAGEDDQVADIDSAIASVQSFISKEMAEPVTAGGYMSGIRAGARNSATDQGHIDAIHAHVTALGASAHANDDTSDSDASDGDDTDAASRSGDALTTLTIVGRPDPVAVRVDIDSIAARVAAETVKRLTG